MLKLVEHTTENPSHNANIINFDDTCCSPLCILSIYICKMIQLYNNYLIELATYVLKVLLHGKIRIYSIYYYNSLIQTTSLTLLQHKP